LSYFGMTPSVPAGARPYAHGRQHRVARRELPLADLRARRRSCGAHISGHAPARGARARPPKRWRSLPPHGDARASLAC
jgi:hypothetical protein